MTSGSVEGGGGHLSQKVVCILACEREDVTTSAFKNLKIVFCKSSYLLLSSVLPLYKLSISEQPISL